MRGRTSRFAGLTFVLPALLAAGGRDGLSSRAALAVRAMDEGWFESAPRRNVPRLAPDWTWRTAAGIEWAAIVSGGAAPAALVATPQGQLQVVDLGSGRPQLAQPIQAGRGVRAAERPRCEKEVAADTAYAFDRHAAYAIRLTAPAELLWQSGRSPAAGEEFQGDPESLTGWTHAQVTDRGLLLVNIDGQVVLLDRADGHVRWETRLDRLPVARVHVRGQAAIVLWKAGGLVRAAFLEVDAQPPTPVVCDLRDVWPLWSELLPEGLVTVSSERVGLWSPGSPPHDLNIPVTNPRSTSVDVFAAGATLLVIADEIQLAAYESTTGRRVWNVRSRPSATCTVVDSRVLTTDTLGTTVRDAATGRYLGRSDGVRERIACQLGGELLYTLDRSLDRPTLPWELRREDVPASVERSRRLRETRRARFDLEPMRDVRQVLCTHWFLVLVGTDSLRAYTLPWWDPEPEPHGTR